jgi:hypothetical protein
MDLAEVGFKYVYWIDIGSGPVTRFFDDGDELLGSRFIIIY